MLSEWEIIKVYMYNDPIRMGGGLHFLVEIELKMAKMPAFTNLKSQFFIFYGTVRI